MRLSHIHIQQTLLTLSNKKNSEEIAREVECRSNNMINQISIFNSTFDHHVLPKFTDSIEFLIIRRSKMMELPTLQIFGRNLKIVQLPNCHLKQLPMIHSDNLHKLNVSHNQIQEIGQISNKSLKLLDVRNNKITRITRDIYSIHLTVLHQFVSKKKEKSFISLPLCLRPMLIDIEKVISESIKDWSNTELIEICEEIIENNNDVLLHQILPYLTSDFVAKIFQISKLKRKHCIIELLIKTQNCNEPTNEEALQLFMPQFISQSFIFKITLNSIFKAISSHSTDKQRVQRFFDFLIKAQKQKNLLIQSEKDLINFMSLNLSFPNQYEVDFLMTQIVFFDEYDFSNQTILKYLLHFDNLKLIKKLLQLPNFKNQIFALGLYKKLLKPNKKLFKVLQVEDKRYQRDYKYKNELYFPEYKQRKSFCLKNDLYDYQILAEYEQMQCSYSRKDLKYTFKFCNKENEISVAKRIQTQLKRKCLKNMQIRKSQYSSNSSYQL